jgi:hypothetical protein
MNVKRLYGILSALILVVAVASITWAQLPAVPIHVSVSKGTVLTLKEPSPRVSISNPDVAEVNVIPQKCSSTKKVIVYHLGGKVWVPTPLAGDISQLQEQIQEIAPNDNKGEL